MSRLTYEPLPAVHNPPEAWAEGAPLVFDEEETNVQAYKHIARGDADTAIKNSSRCHLPALRDPVDRACVPRTGMRGLVHGQGRLRHGALPRLDQSSHTTLHERKLLLGSDKVRVQNQLVGGGFGGKEDMSVQHHAALITYLTGKTVKVKLTRPESLLIHPKRHPFWMDFTMGCGAKTASFRASRRRSIPIPARSPLWAAAVLERACNATRQAPRIIRILRSKARPIIPTIRRRARSAASASAQTCFATETLLDEMADKVGITPWEIRYRNAIRPGQELPNGQIVGSETGLVETLEAVKPYYDAAMKAGKPVGIACAMKNAGVGVGIPDWGRCKLIVEDDGKLHIYSGRFLHRTGPWDRSGADDHDQHAAAP